MEIDVILLKIFPLVLVVDMCEPQHKLTGEHWAVNGICY